MKKIVYDGSCKLCTISIDKVRKSSSGGEFEYIDYTKDGLPEGIDKDEAAKEIHVVDHEGRVHKNADGMMEILHTSLRWR